MYNMLLYRCVILLAFNVWCFIEIILFRIIRRSKLPPRAIRKLPNHCYKYRNVVSNTVRIPHPILCYIGIIVIIIIPYYITITLFYTEAFKITTSSYPQTA